MVNKRIYFDNGSTTPLDNRVKKTMLEQLNSFHANPNAIYLEAQNSTAYLETCRYDVASILQVEPSNIIFTSGASESNSLAIIGLGLARRDHSIKLVLGPTEHSSVLEAASFLRKYHGFKLEFLPADKHGRIIIEAAEKIITKNTCLVAVGFACSEIGTCQPLTEIGAICRQHQVPWHLDAVQAVGYFDLRFNQLGISSATISGHKIYGPNGIGLLYLKEGQDIVPLIYGGDQEKGRRAGTENLLAISGLKTALQLTQERSIYQRVAELTADFRNKLQTNFKNLIFTGDPVRRLPFHISFIVPGHESQKLLIKLDMHGVGASAGSACNIGKQQPLAVLLKLGFSPQEASCALRLTLGKNNTAEEVEKVLEIIDHILKYK